MGVVYLKEAWPNFSHVIIYLSTPLLEVLYPPLRYTYTHVENVDHLGDAVYQAYMYMYKPFIIVLSVLSKGNWHKKSAFYLSTVFGIAF